MAVASFALYFAFSSFSIRANIDAELVAFPVRRGIIFTGDTSPYLRMLSAAYLLAHCALTL